MTINLRGKLVAVEKIKASDQSEMVGGLKVLNTEEHAGRIVYLGEDASKDLQIGQKVYHSDKYQVVTMGGKQVSVMEDSQIYAFVK